MSSAQEIEWHMGVKGGYNRSIGQTGPLIPECGTQAYFICASHGSGIKLRNQEHILAEFRVLLAQKTC
jgi:hypothetical protein